MSACRYWKAIYLSVLLVIVAGCRESARVPSVSPPTPESHPTLVQAETKEPQAKLDQTPSISSDQKPEATESEALAAFLMKFDLLSKQGFVPTLRRGSTGVGYTLETMLGVPENNSPGGDFMGMELKAFRDDDLHMDDAEKMNLFLKEPHWVDGLVGKQRVSKYGYVDENGRPALYSTVTIKESSHGFVFRVDFESQRLWLVKDGKDIAFWNFLTLERRLIEKHSEAVFVSARAHGAGKNERFHYYGVTWCAEPSVDSFVRLVEAGAVMLELRMHLKPNGSLRNHGSAFRIKQNRIPDLYRVSRQVRP